MPPAVGQTDGRRLLFKTCRQLPVHRSSIGMNVELAHQFDHTSACSLTTHSSTLLNIAVADLLSQRPALPVPKKKKNSLQNSPHTHIPCSVGRWTQACLRRPRSPPPAFSQANHWDAPWRVCADIHGGPQMPGLIIALISVFNNHVSYSCESPSWARRLPDRGQRRRQPAAGPLDSSTIAFPLDHY